MKGGNESTLGRSDSKAGPVVGKHGLSDFRSRGKSSAGAVERVRENTELATTVRSFSHKSNGKSV